MGRIMIDKFNEAKTPDIYLAQKNKHILGCLNVVSGLKMSFYLNDMDTCTFSIPRMNKGKKNNLYDEVEPKMLILVVGYGWYEINVSLSSSDGYEIKEVSGKALENELTQFAVHDFYINSLENDVLYDDYIPVVFYKPIVVDKNKDLLHRILEECPGWTIGHVDNELYDMQRTFEIDDKDVYSLLTSDVSEAFGCFFIFDSFNRTINAFVTENYGRDTNIFISFENLNETVQIDVDDTKIKTVYRLVSNTDYLVPNEVNPTGTDKICDYSYYLSTKYMRQSTIDSYNAYLAQYKIYEPIYQDLLLQTGVILTNKYNLETKGAPTTDLENWSLYGIIELKAVLVDAQDSLNVLIALGKGMASSTYYATEYLPAWNKVQAIESALKVLNTQLATYESQLSAIDAQKDNITQILNIRNFFTEEDWEDLNYHSYLANYTNENYVVTDEDNDAERQVIEIEFLKAAQKDLAIAARPQYSFATTTNNLLSRREFEKIWDDFELGNFIRVEVNDTYSVKMRLIGYAIDFDNLQSIDVTYSDVIDMGGVLKDGQSILAQASSTSASVNNSKTKWNDGATQGTWVSRVRQEGLNSAEVMIANADDETTILDERGITGRKWNDQRQDYDPEQYRLTHNLFAFTDDNWQSVKAAFGKMLIDGNWVYGLIADVLIGRFVLGDYLYIQNEGQNLTFDQNGLRVDNGINTVEINANSNEIFKITDGTKTNLYITPSGDLWMTGTYTASNGVNTITIDPNNSSRLFQITSGGADKMYFNSKGDLWMTGTLQAGKVLSSYIQVSNGINAITIDPNNSHLFSISKVATGQELLYFDEYGNATFEGRMTIGAIFSENWLTTGGSADGSTKGTKGTYINLTDGTFHFGGDHLELTENFLQVNGVGDYSWMGRTFGVADVYTKIEQGKISLKHKGSGEYDLNITPTGISSTLTANANSTCTIDFYSKVYGDGLVGMTLQTYGSPIALKSKFGPVLVNPYAENGGNDTSLFRFSHSGVQGMLAFGTFSESGFTGYSGLKFSGIGEEALVTILSNTGDIGSLKCKDIKATNIEAASVTLTSGTLGGSNIATKTELDLLKESYETSLASWEAAYNAKVAELTAMTASRDSWMDTANRKYWSCDSCCIPCP